MKIRDTIKNGYINVTDAVGDGYIDILNIFLTNGGNVNFRDPKTNISLLTIACENERFDIIDRLLAAGANVNIKPNSPLIRAINTYNIKISTLEMNEDKLH